MTLRSNVHRLSTPRARLGVIIPSGNRLVEPQFHHYASEALGLHFARLRMTGPHARPLAAMAEDLARTAATLADARVDLIAFHCTATSMKEGPDGEGFLAGVIEKETGLPAVTTGAAAAEALRALDARRLSLVSPYGQAANDHERRFLEALGFHVVVDVALGLRGGDEYIGVPPERWAQLAREADRPEVDACFLSCANTRQIEAVEPAEAGLGKPVATSNQAMLWACCRRLASKLGPDPMGLLPGRLARL